MANIAAAPDTGLAFARPARISLASNYGVRRRRKHPVSRQHRLKSEARVARAGIVAPELFNQFLVAMDKAQAALHAGFGGVTFAALRRALESRVGRTGRD